MRKLGIDVGYGFTKAAAETEGDISRHASFASAVIAARNSDLSTLSGGQVKHLLSIEDMASGRSEYAIGSAALALGADRAWANGVRTGYLPLVIAAALAVGASGQLEVALGLPLGVYLKKDERARLRAAVEGVNVWASLDKAEARQFSIGRVRVYPQGYGAYLSALSSFPALSGQFVGLIDVGYRTTEYLLFSPTDGVSIPDEKRSGSLDVGVSMALDAVRSYVAQEVGAAYSPPTSLIEEAVARGVITVRGREVHVSEAWNSAGAMLAEQVLDAIHRAWGERMDFLAALLLAGGGGEVLARHLPEAQVLPRPVYANAEGFLMRARAQDPTHAPAST
ncbi:MAG: ParM/StbA family protein [Thermaerobacter sp.]|nr:ParM/StbA family protein [Thermaerobacter sp.]